MRYTFIFCFMVFSAMAGESAQEEAKKGDRVAIHYTGTLSDKTVFDSSKGRDPLAFVLGLGQVIPGFDKAVTGMKPGETKTVTIPAKDAYGPYDKKLLRVVKRSYFPAHVDVKKGMKFQSINAMGFPQIVTVLRCGNEEVSLDANHPLAGKNLTFQITLIKVENA